MPRSRIGTVLVVAALGLAACGDDDAASQVTVPADETTTSSTTSPTSTTEDPTAAVERAFYEQWDAFVEITSDPDIENPLIDEFFGGEAEQTVLDGVSRLLSDGHAIRLPDDPSRFEPRIVETRLESPSRAVVYECTVEGLVIYDRVSGQVVDDTVSNFESRNVFELIDGRFKVTETRNPEGDEPGCDGA